MTLLSTVVSTVALVSAVPRHGMAISPVTCPIIAVSQKTTTILVSFGTLINVVVRLSCGLLTVPCHILLRLRK